MAVYHDRQRAKRSVWVPRLIVDTVSTLASALLPESGRWLATALEGIPIVEIRVAVLTNKDIFLLHLCKSVRVCMCVGKSLVFELTCWTGSAV